VEKSPDAFRTISEAAEELDVPQHVLRFWETRFPQIKPMKRAGGRRYYRPNDLELLRGIRSLLYKEGYTIRGLQRILKEEGVAYVVGIGRGDIVARKRDSEMDGVPEPGKAQIAPRISRSAPKPGLAPLARPAQPSHQPPPATVVVHALSDTQAEALKSALRELGDARKLLDPTARP
jgi:DNA-binding transcriptional MerR regulator